MNLHIALAFEAMERHPKLARYVCRSISLPLSSRELRISEDRFTLSLLKLEPPKVVWSQHLEENQLRSDPHTEKAIPTLDTEDFYASTPLVSEDHKSIAIGTWRKRVCIYNLETGKLEHLLLPGVLSKSPAPYDVFPFLFSRQENRLGILALGREYRRQIYDLETHALMEDRVIDTADIP